MAIDKLGRYEIKEELERGGMATVYIGYDPTMKRTVAVKVLPPQFTHDLSFSDRFQIEAETIAELEHNAIVPVYDYGEDNEFPYLVMRLMLGGTLAKRIENGPVPIAETVTITRRICEALDKAHTKGIIHRDIKPSNILFDEDGYAYLGDFGIVKIAEATRTTQMIGTPEYMVPEQIEDQPVDRRTDVYQMGIVIFEMLTGQQPYTASSTTAILFKHVRDPIPILQEFNPQLPASCQDIINKAMAKDPANRFATAGELASALGQALLQGDRPVVPVKEKQSAKSKTGLEMIHIPAGEFLYGDDKRKRNLPEYWISKTPVTNEHYARFVKDADHNPPRYWKGKTLKAELANHPVTYVSWNDAKAYADWAGMHLPTEEEWEKAARGTDGRIYPWGNEWHEGYCNTREADIGGTTPVGHYSPKGGSPYGCLDMAGNVWEWTASWSDDVKDERVLRGGSWHGNQSFARAVYRAYSHPANRSRSGGFRVVVRRPPSQ